MQKIRKLASVLLTLILLLAAIGCQQKTPEDEPQVLKVREGEFLPIKERQQIVPFQGTDLYAGETISFGTDAEGRVRMLSFFSLG